MHPRIHESLVLVQPIICDDRAGLAFLAKRSFSLHGPDGSVAFRRSRPKALHFLEQQPKCVVEACGSYRGREKLGHEVRLLPPVYVKPFVKRERCRGRGRRSRAPPDVRRREDRGTAVGGRRAACSRGSGRRFAVASSALQLRRALPTSGSLRCWRLPPCAPLKQGLNEKIAEQQDEGRRGLEAEHAWSRGRFGSLRTGRTPGATSRPGSV